MDLNDVYTMPIGELIDAFVEQTGQSQNAIGKAVGISGSQVSQVKAGTYKGDMQKAVDTMRSYFEKELSNYSKKKGVRAKDVFILFEHVEDVILDIEDAIEDEQMLLIRGKSGSGKTTLLEYTKDQYRNAVIVTGVRNVTEKNFMAELLRALGGTPKGSTDMIYSEIRAILKDKNKIVLIDEANHLNYATLERLRALWDATRRAFVLAGTPDGISEILIEHRQIESRVLNTQTTYLSETEIAMMIEAFGFARRSEYVAVLSAAFGGMTRKTAWALEKWGKLIARGAPESVNTLEMAIQKMM